MKNYIKRTIDTLEALDCRLDHADHEQRTDRWLFTHPNAPGEQFKVSTRSSETACRAVVQRARAAAGLATSETPAKASRKRDSIEKVRREAERRRIQAAREAALAQREREELERLAAKRAQQVSSLDRMMRGAAATGPSPLPPDRLFTIEQLVDELDVAKVALERAIDDGSLEAYMCSGVVKVKGADAMAWAHQRRTA